MPLPAPPYLIGGLQVSPRRAFGDAPTALASVLPNLVVLDGDVGNSTYTVEFESVAKERFIEGYIAEQNIVGVAMGLATQGKVPFASAFACFLSRAYDFARMAAVGHLNIKLAGTHVGVSIGEDGASQMALEDLAMFCAQPNYTVLYLSDATSTWFATCLLAEATGPSYLRLGRPDATLLYSADEKFEIGKCKVLRQSANDQALIVAAGVTLFEALDACDALNELGIQVCVIDLFSVQPIDGGEIVQRAGNSVNVVITVEDHYAHGGLGDAVASALCSSGARIEKLAVSRIPRSGKPSELLDMFGISADHIVAAVQRMTR
jgi:transketolase